MSIQITDLSAIQLTGDDLSDFSPRLTSAQPIYSPTAPGKPACVLGWRDRWCFNNAPAQTLAISYWLFASDEEALSAAAKGRLRLSARTVLINGSHESIYLPQSKIEADSLLADRVWQGDGNFLFVRRNIAGLVAEFGKQISPKTTLSIARRILEKIHNELTPGG
jgi:hypothetical protein